MKTDTPIEVYFEKSIVLAQVSYAEALDRKALDAYSQLLDSLNKYREACEKLLKRRNPDLYSLTPGYGVNYVKSITKVENKYILYVVLLSGAIVKLDLDEVLEVYYG